MGRLEGRVAIITGAGRGIGAALARSMAMEGCAVVANDLGVGVDGSGADRAPATEVVDEIVSAGGVAKSDFADVADFQAAEGIIERTLEEFGRLDVLVNVAGILRDRMIFNMSEDEWDAVIRVHLKGTFNTCKHASVYWRKERGGQYRIINFTSGSGLHGAPGQPNYAAAKLGIVGLTYSLANSLAPYGVTANAIAPGAATRMTASIPEARRRNLGLNSDDPRRSPDNIAPAVIYLASEASEWLNGQVIGASGYRISLYSNPEPIREISSPIPWDLDDACNQIEQSFRPAVEALRASGRRKKKGDDQRPASAKAAYDRLVAGNERFSLRSPALASAAELDDMFRRNEAGQQPYATILTCADARLSPAMLFDELLGELFVVREAGNVAVSPTSLGSLEFAHAVLETVLLVVLGHQDCAAVDAAFTNSEVPGNIQSVVDAIKPGITDAHDLDEAVAKNVRAVIASVRANSAALSNAEIVGAIYDVGTGKVRFLDPPGSD